MRLTVDHRTTYRFSVPQGRLTQLLRLTPAGTDGQAVANWGIHVDCDARMRHGRDGFGNRTTMLYVEGPIDNIEIEVSGEVLTNVSDGVLHGSIEPLPPAVFLRTTPLTDGGEALAAFSSAAAGTVADPVARLHALNLAFHRRFELDQARPVAGRSAAEAFALDAVTPRDLAQMFVAGARSLSLPARYVSGYSTACFSGDSRPAPHGWAEAHIDGLGWVAFDPCTGLSADEAYVRVAVALDSAGAAPVAGSRLGEGREELEVDVTVDVEQ
ncbi:transglutaminase family protein [Sphingomonas sp. So64.6b]|uniref:transglutaminase family protein n=1 Tax=Sphingomonas sp. So64.6b TaxID=2997354 RepID=UPI001603F095|nr:transglutaminase family protein [Sphingomonas sp. So64.6b]QNA84410.1 transglutaminase family protein [Sphingomonas sp. So64.6b]